MVKIAWDSQAGEHKQPLGMLHLKDLTKEDYWLSTSVALYAGWFILANFCISYNTHFVSVSGEEPTLKKVVPCRRSIRPIAHIPAVSHRC
jgi:hypothetical protein